MRFFHTNALPLSAAIISASSARREELQQLAIECGCRLRQLEEGADFILVDICSNIEPADTDYLEIKRYAAANVTEILLWAALEDVDTAFALLSPHRCHFIVEAGDVQAVPILSGAFRRVKAELHEEATEGELGALHRISSELADFARTLARIAEQDKAGDNAVRDKPIGFRQAAPDTFKAFARIQGPQPDTAVAGSGPKQIREIIKLRRMRDRYLGADLFADPGWDILLDLFAAKQEGQDVSVSSLCIAAAVPPTTALRWITNMTDAGYLVRRQDPYDARRVYIELSESMTEKLKSYFESIADRLALPI